MPKKIRIGLLGLGRAGRLMHIPEASSYPDKFEFTAAADHDPERRKDLPEALNHAKIYASCDELIADPNVDLVSIALRHLEHVPYAIKALDAGKFVNIDKPVALNETYAAELKAAAERHPGKLFPRQNRRFEPVFVKARQLISTGVLGKITMVKLHRCCGYCRRNDWMTMTEFGGGLLTNWGPHIVDQALRYIDAPIVDLWADVRSVLSIGDGDDQIKLLLRGKNGIVADVEISGTNAKPGRELEIWGERGTLYYDPNIDANRIFMRFVDPDCKFKHLKPHPENPPLRYGNFDEKLTFIEQQVDIPDIPGSEIWKYIYDSAAKGKPFPIRLEESLEAVRICCEAFRSSKFKPAEHFLR